MGVLHKQEGKKMKQPKKLVRANKEIVASNNLNPDNWALIKETEFYLNIINKNSGITKRIDRYVRKK